MKQSQWILAAFFMALMISITTVAMSYLGGSRQQAVDPAIRAAREIVFMEKLPLPFGILEREERSRGHVDFWFYNPNEEAVQVGLQRKSCKCGSVELFVLPEDRRPWVARTAAAACGVAPFGPLNAIALCGPAVRQIQHGVEGNELLTTTEKATVPPGQFGWARIGWSDRTGKQSLEATLWYDDPAVGKTRTLNIALFFHEPFRVRSNLRLGTFKEAALEKGVRASIVVWSSTRASIRLEAEADKTRESAQNDPFIVGKPVPLTPAEYRALNRANNEGTPSISEDTRGSILCAYRIPILLQAIAPDGKTPFDIGPFARRVNISSPDTNGDPKSVLVTGRVRGIVEIGNEQDNGRINFHDFARSRGKVESVDLMCHDQKIELAFDRQRTARFLDAELVPVTPTPAGVLQAWTLRAKVLPLQADGEFPRPTDPLYEDSAIYLKVSFPGEPRNPPRTVRIPVTGRASGR